MKHQTSYNAFSLPMQTHLSSSSLDRLQTKNKLKLVTLSGKTNNLAQIGFGAMMNFRSNYGCVTLMNSFIADKESFV